MFFVYILVCSDGSYYVGQTRDVERRFAKHVEGTAAAFTGDHRPERIAYIEELPTRKAAMARERQIKGWARAKKEALIAGHKGKLHVLSRRRSR